MIRRAAFQWEILISYNAHEPRIRWIGPRVRRRSFVALGRTFIIIFTFVQRCVVSSLEIAVSELWKERRRRRRSRTKVLNRGNGRLDPRRFIEVTHRGRSHQAHHIVGLGTRNSSTCESPERRTKTTKEPEQQKIDLAIQATEFKIPSLRVPFLFSACVSFGWKEK